MGEKRCIIISSPFIKGLALSEVEGENERDFVHLPFYFLFPAPVLWGYFHEMMGGKTAGLIRKKGVQFNNL